VFFDEYWSVLLRTIHSIYNRTPHELINEIILVNDNSTTPELYEPLQKYVNENFNGLVKLLVMNERKGLVGARLAGARKASGDVLVNCFSILRLQISWLLPFKAFPRCPSRGYS
jgi:polypeptide N-acetylgalactosaminyltransferase